MTERPNAVEHFRGASRYNCAQAVLKAYASLVGMENACLDRFSSFGGGRAPDGECGALFAAKSLFHDECVKQEIESEFVCAAGNKKCREIRKGKTFTCEQCVQAAADAIHARLGDGHVLRPPRECDP